jgi:hypothetical protein
MKQTNNDLRIQERGFPMWLRAIMVLTCFFIATPSFAHGADMHVLGAIMAIDANHVEIKTPKGQSVNVQLNRQTRYRDESNPKGANRPAVGDRVVIAATKGEKKGANLLVATEVHFSSTKRVPVLAQPIPTE